MGKIIFIVGVISFVELFVNKVFYNGKLVKIIGKCVKINLMIMGWNWVYI